MQHGIMWSASRFDSFAPGEDHDTCWIGGYVGGAEEKRVSTVATNIKIRQQMCQ